MDRNSQIVVQNTIQYLIQHLWTGVAQSIIRKKLALKASELQVIQFIGSYISNATDNKQIQLGMQCQTDPITIQIDTMAYGQLPKQQKQNKQNFTHSRKGSVNQSINQTRSRRFTVSSFNKDKSPESKNVSFSDAPGLITLPEVEDPHYVVDPKQDDCRNKVFRNQKQESAMKKMLAERNKQRQENGIKNKKLLKDLKKYTYDYDGKFFNVGAAQNQHQKAIKLQKQNGQQSISSKQMKVPQQKYIGNQKIKERETRNNKQFSKADKNMPQFNQNRPDSLLDMFSDEQQNLAEGVKLVGEKGKQKVVKQKPRRKLSGMKKYRLNQYQGIIKDNKFKDFKIPNSKRSAATIDVNKTAPLNSSYNPELKNIDSIGLKSNINSTSQVSLTLKKEQPNSLLPPIQSTYLKKNTKIGIKRLSVGISYQESEKSILDESGAQSRRSRKSQIKVDHQQLYFQNFSLNAYGK